MTKSKSEGSIKRNLIAAISPDTPLWDGFDDAIIGYDTVTEKAVYDENKMISVLVERDGMTTEEAIDYLSYNVLYTHIGVRTPIHIRLF